MVPGQSAHPPRLPARVRLRGELHRKLAPHPQRNRQHLLSSRSRCGVPPRGMVCAALHPRPPRGGGRRRRLPRARRLPGDRRGLPRPLGRVPHPHQPLTCRGARVVAPRPRGHRAPHGRHPRLGDVRGLLVRAAASWDLLGDGWSYCPPPPALSPLLLYIVLS